MATGSGTREDPWQLKTPPGTSDIMLWRDPDANPPALVCEGTTFELFLSAVLAHNVQYDPGSWLVPDPREQKKRNQFRVTKRRLSSLYKSLREQPF